MRRYALIKIKYPISALLALLLLLPLAALAAPVGKISNLAGNVDITVAGKSARIAIMGDSVNIGDFIRTKSKSKVEITFNEGNILRLAENTRVGITQYMSGEKQNSSILNLFRGRIQNVVKSIGIGGGRYEVHTPTAVCGVRGTFWFVGQENGKTDVAVLEGTVAATSYVPAETAGGTPQQVEVILNAGQGTVLTGTTTPQVTTISDQQFQQLRNATEISETSGSSGGTGYNAGFGSTPPPPPVQPQPLPASPTYTPPIVVPPPVQPVRPAPAAPAAPAEVHSIIH
jgi:hypothetical protein